jgi:hypothetical protein
MKNGLETLNHQQTYGNWISYLHDQNRSSNIPHNCHTHHYKFLMTPKPKLEQGHMTENDRRTEVAQRLKASEVGETYSVVPVYTACICSS